MLKLILALALLTPSAVLAADAPAPVAAPAAAVSAAEMKERIKLATEYHDAVNLRDIINRDIEKAGAGLTGDDKERYMRDIQLQIDYDKIEALSIKSMAETFTVPELKALIAYYGSPEGQMAQAKMDLYTGKVSPEIRKAVDTALMNAQFGGKPAP